MIEDGELDKRVARRYAGWNGELGQQILNGQMTLSDIAQYAAQLSFTAGQTTVKAQEFIDKILPSLLPLLFTLGMYKLIRKGVNI
uniref:PTS system mannose/fructose/sorbose family transporter subunit IID n=1 Tax=Klebsiella pneumoniae TaxID=573 RepID=UPI001CB899AA